MRITRPLFNAHVLKTAVAAHIAAGRGPTPEHLDTMRGWHSRISRGLLRGYTETQVEQSFSQSIFVEILGYTPLGKADPYFIVPKRTGGTGRDFPDFVLGIFHPAIRIEKWRVVGEIKSIGVNLDLAQSSRYSRETPVQQAFRYALNGRPGVEWIIVTNFQEIRLYRNGFAAAYHSWSLEELCDFERLAEFYVLILRDHLVSESGESETLRLFEKSQNAGLALTEGFYGLYNLARQELISEIRKSTRISIADDYLYGKAHKLLNRILFIAFCEDHPAALLPENTLRGLHIQAKNARRQGAYWAIFKTFFSLLNEGSPPGAPEAYNAFNGGLFAPDSFLDGLNLPNHLFEQQIHFKARGRTSRGIEGIFGFYVYDFHDELDVDSLGAIFEQSLKDLPFLTRALRGHSDTSLTRREATGVYYTPKAITQFMVSQALDAYFSPIQNRLRKEVEGTPVRGKLLKFGRRRLTAEETRDYIFLQRLIEELRTTTILDPACGSGAFLVTAFEELHQEYQSVNEGLGSLGSAAPLFGLDRFILRNNIFGSDILSESVEISKLGIWLRTAAPREPLEKLDDNIWAADSLRYDNGMKYSIIVSNPPWGADLTGWTDEELIARFPDCGVEKDSFSVFAMRAHELLEDDGVLSLILPNSWLTVQGYEAFRRWFQRCFELLELINVWKIFKDVNHDACIVIARKKKSPHPTESASTSLTHVGRLTRGTSEPDKWQQLAARQWDADFTADPSLWEKEKDCRFETIYPPDVAKEIDAMAERAVRLEEVCDITVGIQVYHKRKVDSTTIREKAFHSTYRKGRQWHPFITGNEVQRYFGAPAANSFLYYSDQLCDKRELNHYENPRILIQQIIWGRLRAWYEVPNHPILYLNTIFSCSSPRKGFSLPFILAVLNSRLMSACYERWTNRLFGDKFPKLSKIDLSRLPIPWPARIDRSIENCGKELNTLWSELKAEVLSFEAYLATSDSSGFLGQRLQRFWRLNRRDIIEILGSAALTYGSADAQRFVIEWQASVKSVNELWSRIADLEAECDDLVRMAYGIKRDVYNKLVSSIPEISIDEVLLPKVSG
jgi:hypothetical protein